MAALAVEGDLVENSKGVIFDVKGLIHPPDRIVAFPRFIPDPTGNRRKRQTLYGKVYALDERYRFLRKKFPSYLVYDPVFDEMLCEVPVDDVRKHYKPVKRLKEILALEKPDLLETQATNLAVLLKETARISLDAIGVTGSILAGLHKTDSDIDLVVYGIENGRRVHSTLRSHLKDRSGPLKPYSREDLKKLFAFRSKDTFMDFGDFVRTESGKALQGMFSGIDYFIRCVKDQSEIHDKYGKISYKNVGYSRIKATIADDAENILTPCKYRVEKVTVTEGLKTEPLLEIVSFRGRFCEQAKAGETVIAQGKVENVTDKKHNNEHFRLLLGNKPSDFMILA